MLYYSSFERVSISSDNLVAVCDLLFFRFAMLTYCLVLLTGLAR